MSISTVTSQLILHPVVSHNLKILSTTLGRDKVYRAIQNFARLFAWVLLSRGYQLQAVRWNALKSHLALGRKLLRLAKPLEHLQAALRASQTRGEKGEQITTIARQLSYFGYLTYDAIVWANAIKFISLKSDTAQRVNKTANRFWLAGILFSLTHSLLKAGRLAQEAKSLRSSAWSEKNLGGEAEREAMYRALDVTRAATRYQFTMDCLDLWLPAASIGLVNFNEGILGLLGVITSVMSLRTQWHGLQSKK